MFAGGSGVTRFGGLPPDATQSRAVAGIIANCCVGGCGGLGRDAGGFDHTSQIGAGHEEIGDPQMGLIMVKREEKTKRKLDEADKSYIRSGAAIPSMASPLARVWRQAAVSTSRAWDSGSSSVNTRTWA